MYHNISPFLFRLDPETAHSVGGFFIKKIATLPIIQDILVKSFVNFDPKLENEILGMKFLSPVGLAAGFDKNARMVRGLITLGFGFVEVGTITKISQSGNKRPRLWRFVEERSLQNCMGFNNLGASQVASHLKQVYPFVLPIGANIGKNKILAQADSLKNYEDALVELEGLADYFVFNVSSPNTPNLRDLQNVEFMKQLFEMAREKTQKPLFLKISPDMHDDDMLAVVEAAIKHGAHGIIATNTSIDYSLLDGAKEQGGLSGAVITQKSREVFEKIANEFFGKAVLISAGGIMDAEEAYLRIKMGASLVQTYTGFIYEGPGFIKSLNEGIAELLKCDGLNNISEAIGILQKRVDLGGEKPKVRKKVGKAEAEQVKIEISESSPLENVQDSEKNQNVADSENLSVSESKISESSALDSENPHGEKADFQNLDSQKADSDKLDSEISSKPRKRTRKISLGQ